MSLTTATKTSVEAQVFPHVDLLPPEISQEQRFRSIRAMLGLVLVGAVAVVGGLTYLANGQVDEAQTNLDVAQVQGVALQKEAAKYADVPKVYAQVAVAQAQLSVAMGQDVRYSYVLNDLSLTASQVSGVWFDSLNLTQPVDKPMSATSALGTPVVAVLTIDGTGRKHNDVAAFLDALAKRPYYTDPYFNSSTDALIGDTTVVNFSSQVSLNQKAYSNRYTPKAGG